MHIAGGLTLVRRDQAQSNVAGAPIRRARWRAWRQTPEPADAARGSLRKKLPGAILLTALALLGAVFPILF